MKKALILGLLSATCLITTTAMAEVRVSFSHTEVPSKAPIFAQQLESNYQLPPQYVDLKEQRLAKDVGNQVISTPKSALKPGKNWFGLNHKRVYAYLDQHPEVKELVINYMYRQGITNFLDVTNFVTIQQAVDDELTYDFLNKRWFINDLKQYVQDENHPFVKYHKSRMTPEHFQLFQRALNSQPAQENAVTSIKTLVVQGMVLQDFYDRKLPTANIHGADL